MDHQSELSRIREGCHDPHDERTRSREKKTKTINDIVRWRGRRETDHVTTYLHYKLPTCVFTAYKENKGR